jgi:hypothetical protein
MAEGGGSAGRADRVQADSLFGFVPAHLHLPRFALGEIPARVKGPSKASRAPIEGKASKPDELRFAP